MEESGKAWVYALRVLTRRDHSIAEIERKLADRGFSSADILGAIARLKRSGYLDDRRFAERWAETAVRNSRGFGRRILSDLLRKGIAPDIASETVNGISAACNEAEVLAVLAAKKFPRFDPQSSPDREKRRVFSYLQRRGFSTSAILGYFRMKQGLENGFK